MRHFLIDTDTASDDAVALVMAINYPNINIEAITVVGGNVPIEPAVQNALYTVELCGAKIPVFQGSSRPLFRGLETAQFVHGKDGMGDIGLQLTGRKAASGNAIDAIIDTIHAFPHEIELVTLGPLTNIALALLKEPSIAKKVKQCTIMGGVGKGPGNITPVSEYNIWADPEAAKIVFESEMPKKMVGWDVALQCAWFDEKTGQELRDVGTKLARFCRDIQKTVIEFNISLSNTPGFNLPDPIAMAVALDESIATESQSLYVEVMVSDNLARGQTVVDHLASLKKAPNTEVVFEASREKFLKLLHESVA